MMFQLHLQTPALQSEIHSKISLWAAVKEQFRPFTEASVTVIQQYQKAPLQVKALHSIF